MQQVIFVGGTSYSGSTLLDMILSHDATGFSCGELSSYIYPYRAKHLRPVCGCGDPACDVWQRMTYSETGAHLSLFREFPEKRFHVDSSKSPVWIADQTRWLGSHGIQTANVLIWKTPGEFHASRVKRGLEKNWARDWITYHARFFTLMDDWVALPYSALVQEEDALPRVCAKIGIDHFPGKERYWEQTHHTLFGNASAKIHLFDPDSSAYKAHQQDLPSTTGAAEDCANARHRSIHRPQSTDDPDVQAGERDSMERILSVLGATDFAVDGVDWSSVRRMTAPLGTPPGFFALQRVHRGLVARKTRWLHR